MKTKMNQWIGVTVLVFALSFLLAACTCKSCDDEFPEEIEEDQTELEMVTRRIGNEHLVSLAVCRVYDGKDATLKRFNLDEEPLKISYAFDFVKIRDAMYFVVKGVDFPFLNEICGKGEMDVFLTCFDTYRYADETKDKNHLQHDISDGLIVFRGEWGMYSCMTNSMMSSSRGSFEEFSSHKRFGESSVDKDFTPPIYQFFVKNENEQMFLACRESNEVGYFRPDQALQWTILEGGELVSSENLFSTEELCDIPQISQQCTITGIGENHFVVSSDSNLEKIFFDEYTVFLSDEQPAESTDFAEGDVITVTFNKPYERYNPKVAVANQIIK